MRALGRLATLAKLSAPKVSKSGISQRESGFLTSLRAELEREKEAEKVGLCVGDNVEQS